MKSSADNMWFYESGNVFRKTFVVIWTFFSHSNIYVSLHYNKLFAAMRQQGIG